MSDDPVLSMDVRIAIEAFELAVKHDMPLTGVTALFGHSGSGKTTLLRVFAGLERGAKGRVAFNGEVWQNTSPDPFFLPPEQRAVGYVFQDARLFPHLTVAGNLAFAEQRASGRGHPIKRDAVVARFGLEPLLARNPDDTVRRRAPARCHRPRARNETAALADGRTSLRSWTRVVALRFCLILPGCPPSSAFP